MNAMSWHAICPPVGGVVEISAHIDPVDRPQPLERRGQQNAGKNGASGGR